MFAAAAGDIEVVTNLIALGADVDAADEVRSLQQNYQLPLQPCLLLVYTAITLKLSQKN